MKNKIEKLADAILYEGYLLYPYRKSAIKNHYRFNFGLIEPNDYFQTQVLVSGIYQNLDVNVRFLQNQKRQIIDNEGNKLERYEFENQIFETWDEVVERNIKTNKSTDFSFEIETNEEELIKGKAKYLRKTENVKGKVIIESKKIKENLVRLTVKIFNHSKTEKFISTHAVLSIENAEFVSLLEFENEFEIEVKSLKQKNLFPVLIEKNVMLASPIILYDYPQIAPESMGDFYDSTEIDELLTLRILTMTEHEKKEANSLDSHAQKIIQQTEKTELMNLHGVFREEISNIKIGQKVRLKPKNSADAFDFFLQDKIAIIEKIEEDLEGKKHYAVVLENDEGREFGFDKFIGHRFFFNQEELENL